MQNQERGSTVPGETSTEEPVFALAITALEQAATPAEAFLAFKDAAAGFARTPNAQNARKVEVTMSALRRHRQRAERQATAF